MVSFYLPKSTSRQSSASSVFVLLRSSLLRSSVFVDSSSIELPALTRLLSTFRTRYRECIPEMIQYLYWLTKYLKAFWAQRPLHQASVHLYFLLYLMRVQKKDFYNGFSHRTNPYYQIKTSHKSADHPCFESWGCPQILKQWICMITQWPFKWMVNHVNGWANATRARVILFSFFSSLMERSMISKCLSEYYIVPEKP